MVSIILSLTLIIWSIVLLASIAGIQSGFMDLDNRNAYAQLSRSSSNITIPGMMQGSGEIPAMVNTTNITSSINLIDTITSSLESRINVSLSNATLTAEKSLGNNSHAVAAHLGDENGYLVYNILALTPDKSLSKILIDPGNGNVILSEYMPTQQLMKTRPPVAMAMGSGGPGMLALPALPVPPHAMLGPRMELAPALAPGMFLPK